MTRKDLKTLMYQNGFKISNVARKFEFSSAYIYDMLKGSRYNAEVVTEFETRLGIPFEAIQEAWNNEDDSSEPAPEIIAMQNRIRQQHGLSPVPA